MSQAPDNSQKSEETQTEDSTKPSKEQPRKSSKHYTIEELEEGLKIVGFGRYSLMRLMTLALLLISSVMEVIGSSIVLPAAKCDFDISDSERGAVSAIPYIGIFLTSYFHGYMIDTRGRRRMAIYTSLATGCLSFLSAFMPNLASYAFCKFLASLFVAVPSALPYTYIGEIVPKEHRDMLLSIANALQLVGSALVPIIAWIIIPMQFRFNFGLYYFRPWRLLIMVYALFLIITAYLLTYCPESPKYLLSRGYPEEALKVLQTIYAGNKKLPPEDFPMKSLSGPTPHKDLPILQCLKRQSKPFLKRKYMKYLMLNGFLLFGVFSIFNGLYVWILDVVNRVISEDNADRTACEVIMDGVMMEEVEQICTEDIETQTFMINSFAQLSCAIIGFVFSFTVVKFIGKFYLLLGCYLTIGTFCLFVNYITEPILFIMVISTFPLIALALGPIHAYNVQIYPPHMRGMAGLLCMMFGRVGSIFSSVLIGLLIDEHCNELFFTFTSLQYVCAALLYFHRPNKPKD